MVMTLISNMQIDDIPSQEARPFKAVGIIGNVETRDIANGYTQVIVPLSYRLSNADTTDRQFTARFNIKPEWLTNDFAQAVKNGEVDNSTRIQYDINVKGLLKGLFTGAGIKTGTVDFTTLAGRAVGFKTKLRRDDPSRLDLSYFFQPRM